MSSIFPGSASVGQVFEGYSFNGIAWDLIGNEFNPTSFSPTAPNNPKAGDLWVDSDSNVDILNDTNLATVSDLNNYLTISSASTTYATKEELENIDLSSASAAAVAAIVDSAPSTLNTLNELASALNDDANFSATVTTSLGNKLDISSASATYVAINNMSATPVYVMNSGSSAQRPVSPSSGMFRFNTTSGNPEWYDSISEIWVSFHSSRPTVIEYLVVGGGGGGSSFWQSVQWGNGGGGGYTAQSTTTMIPGSAFTITIGGGGAAGINNAESGFAGNASVFDSVTANGGARGVAGVGDGGYGAGNVNAPISTYGGVGVVYQSVKYAGGGTYGNCGGVLSPPPADSGKEYGGGYATGSIGVGQNTIANRGGGGWGGYNPNPYNGGAGSSGVVILAYPNTFPNLTSIGAGLSYTLDTSTRSGYRVYTFTGGTGTVIL
jgi:hypothetical protein